MAPIAAAIVLAIGATLSTIAQANALRGQARARQVEGEQELSTRKRQLRQELGLSSVSAGASGLLGSSFSDVFESQAIEDAEFLGRIKQRTDFDVANLERQATVTLITGLIGAAGQALGGISSAKGQQARVASLEAQRTALLRATPESRLVPGGNIFGSGRIPGAPFVRTGGGTRRIRRFN